jgi:hypothetical protein
MHARFVLNPSFRCGIADPLGVYDVKDQFGSSAEASAPVPTQDKQLYLLHTRKLQQLPSIRFLQGTKTKQLLRKAVQLL